MRRLEMYVRTSASTRTYEAIESNVAAVVEVQLFDDMKKHEGPRTEL